MRHIIIKIGAALAVAVLALGFVMSSSPAATGGELYTKNGSWVSHTHVFKDAGNNIDCTWPGGDYGYATACVRTDRRTLYVRSDRAGGYYKYGRWKKEVGGTIYQCKNIYRNDSGNDTWVACHWDWPRSGCYNLRSGYGQYDWIRWDVVSIQKCYP